MKPSKQRIGEPHVCKTIGHFDGSVRIQVRERLGKNYWRYYPIAIIHCSNYKNNPYMTECMANVVFNAIRDEIEVLRWQYKSDAIL